MNFEIIRMKDKKIANKKLINKPLYKITPIDLFLFSPFEDEIRGVMPYDKPIPNNKTKLKNELDRETAASSSVPNLPTIKLSTTPTTTWPN